MKKYKSHILAVTTESARIACKSESNPHTLSGFPDGIESFPFEANDLWVGPRDLLESNEAFKQVIPYTIVTRDDKVLVYMRTNKGGEARLHNQFSIGFGGHIDAQDIEPSKNGEAIDLETTVGNAVQRELREELKGEDLSSFEAYGLLLDESDAVGRVHLGIVMIATVSGMVMSREDQIELIGFKTIGELIDMTDSLENWSKIIVQHFAEKEALRLAA